ncbi:PREDICTED: protein FAR1-RELATED SEQUENCE 11-like isoform X2 [Lupinus angustifolius]|uniref:protein FAR1-RELATED SEQUENCE 11-like isoform X2 n=1 Tax=Lupinus angustifolius TaxID=3871 RepID=UPI00092EE7F3|nr:PREDICTED: protein FAR1-RELATED SEQUENCE 11-like isoform X2 [Lupinus angustifolius]
MRVLELEKGIEAGHLPYLEKDVRNFLQFQCSVGNENDASDVLKLCKSLKDIDDAFQYDFTMDDNNKLEHIIWVFGDSIRAYEAFGDVVVFDTTYRINRYDMPLGLWVGIDNHGNSIFFGCVLLRDEKIPSFRWALKVGVAVNIRNQAGEEARMRQKYHNPQIRTSFPIEEHAANILTPYAFQLLQHEIELSSKYAATKIDIDSYIVRYHTKLDGGRLVSLIKEKDEESIHCSCREFEFCGILCRHAIQVLLKNDYFCLPEKYLPSRWRQESSLIPKSSHIINCNDNSSIEFRPMMQCLEVETLKTKDRVVVATKELEQVIELVKKMLGVPKQTIDLESDVRDGDDDDDCDIENPITSKTKGRPKGSRPKGGVEVAKKPRRCHFPNCGGTNHDSRNCPNKRKKVSLLSSQSPNK